MDGYDRLALLISKYPELGSLRKFDRLTLKCLLYKQAEITWLEHELDFLSKSNCDSNDAEKQKLCRSWYDLVRGDEVDDEILYQRAKIEELQTKICSYHAMLLQTAEVFKLLSANSRDVEVLKDWLSRPNGGNRFLGAVEKGPWSGKQDGDLVSLLPQSRKDKFGQRLSDRFLPWYHSLLGKHRAPAHDPDLGQIWLYEKDAFTYAGNVICMALSFAMPTGSIFALYYVQSMLARMIMVAAFIFVFACAMMFAVGSRRGEVFAATAAFAAIQVVFVGGINIGQTP